jgi:hypothetical protein
LQEQLSWQLVTGAALIIASLAVANRQPARSLTEEAPVSEPSAVLDERGE